MHPHPTHLHSHTHIRTHTHTPTHKDHTVKSKFQIIDNKFSTSYDAVEEELKSSTVGLVTLEQMREKRDILVKEREKQIAAALPGERFDMYQTSSYLEGVFSQV